MAEGWYRVLVVENGKERQVDSLRGRALAEQVAQSYADEGYQHVVVRNDAWEIVLEVTQP